MKKTICAAVLLLSAAQVSAASEIDDLFLDQGAVNENYEVIDESIFRISIMHLSVAIKKRVNSTPREAGNKVFVSVLPDGMYYKLTWGTTEARTLTQEEVEAYRDYNFYSMCDLFGDSQVFRKRNWIVRIEVVDINNQRKFSQNIAVKDCPLIEQNLQKDAEGYTPPVVKKIPASFL